MKKERLSKIIKEIDDRLIKAHDGATRGEEVEDIDFEKLRIKQRDLCGAACGDLSSPNLHIKMIEKTLEYYGLLK